MKHEYHIINLVKLPYAENLANRKDFQHTLNYSIV